MSESNFLLKKESYAVIGCCMEVHKNLGCGFLEAVYQEALVIELAETNISFLEQEELRIKYKGKYLDKKYIADFICFDEIIIEIKAVSELNEVHFAQLFNYLKASNLRLGLLINFGSKSLQYKRIIL